jgi:hypothetical protein
VNGLTETVLSLQLTEVNSTVLVHGKSAGIYIPVLYFNFKDKRMAMRSAA